MNQESWEKIEEIFHAARDLSAEERAAFLASVCAGDDELRREVESLLYHFESDNMLSENENLNLGLELLRKENQQSLIGKSFGRYEIVKLLGEGGMGAVYQAKDASLNRSVALKLLPDYLVEGDAGIDRFQKEALAASATTHPNIAHIYEAGIANNQRFIAMELIEGITLRELLRTKKIDLLTALEIVRQTAAALASAHAAGIVHRDIKPENIMIRPDGYVKVLDFGIAKLTAPDASEPPQLKTGENNAPQPAASAKFTKAGLVLGTLGYISLEQLNNQNVDARTDIWSLGVVLYEVLAGRKPFAGATVDELRREITRNRPEPVSFPKIGAGDEALLGKIFAKTLDKDADKRYQTAAELSKDLKELKQNIEFTRQFAPIEQSGDDGVFSPDLQTFERGRTSRFIVKTKQYWTEQSLSKKALILSGLVCLLTFAIGLFIQYFRSADTGQTPQLKTFAPDSRDRLRISTLYGIRKKLQGSIPFLSFAPGGDALAFVMSGEGADDIYLKQLNEDEPTRLTDGRWIYQTPIWSPDGNEIAFVSNRDNKNAVWTMSPRGGAPILRANLEINFVSCQLVKWSGDRRRLYFQSGRTLKTVELDSGLVEEIKFPIENVGTNFSISADESLIAFSTTGGANPKLWIYNVKNGEVTKFADEEHLNTLPVILPDNRRVIYSSNRSGSAQLYIEDFFTKEISQITFGDSNAYSPVVSPDGTRLLYISENNTANVFAADTSTRQESRLTEATKMQLFPAVSGDLAHLVFQVAEEHSNFTKSPFKLKNLQTGTEQTLEGRTGFWPRWSPAGDEIAFLRYEGREFNVWKTRISDNQMQQLSRGGILTGGFATAPFNMFSIPLNWSPDGQKIAFISRQTGHENVWTVSSDGASQQMLTENGDSKIGYNSAVWSPAGGKIAFTRRTQTEPNKFRYDICVLDGRQARAIFQNERKMRLLGWSADAKSLFAAVEGASETEIYELSETAAPKSLTRLVKADFASIALAPDGRALAFSAVRGGVYNIYAYSINGKEKQITDNKEDSILFSGISWSPAGNRIFYSKQSGEIQISMISDKSE